jgi:hypothetical protein
MVSVSPGIIVHRQGREGRKGSESFIREAAWNSVRFAKNIVFTRAHPQRAAATQTQVCHLLSAAVPVFAYLAFFAVNLLAIRIYLALTGKASLRTIFLASLPTW